jgi:hypothetical protein
VQSNLIIYMHTYSHTSIHVCIYLKLIHCIKICMCNWNSKCKAQPFSFSIQRLYYLNPWKWLNSGLNQWWTTKKKYSFEIVFLSYKFCDGFIRNLLLVKKVYATGRETLINWLGNQRNSSHHLVDFLFFQWSGRWK